MQFHGLSGVRCLHTKARLEIQVFRASNQDLVISSETSPPQHIAVITNTSLSFLSTIPEQIFIFKDYICSSLPEALYENILSRLATPEKIPIEVRLHSLKLS